LEKIVSIIMPVACTIMVLLGPTLSSASITIFSSAHAQTNATTNQATPSKQASGSIRGAITDTGQFINNVTQKVAGSKSAQTIVNESSDVLGNATVEAKKFFSPK
jgi:hypothetical protein